MNESGMEYGGEYDSRESKQPSPIDQLAKLRAACETIENPEANAEFELFAYNNTDAFVGERDEWMAARNQWCQRAQRMGQRAAKAEGERDALKQQLAERDGLLERAELAEQLCRARGDMERATEAEYEKLLAERDAEIERLHQENKIHESLKDRLLHSGEEWQTLKAEIERLRHALTDIKCDTGCANDCLVGREGKKDYHARDCTTWIGEIADEALKAREA